jgi:hypothetical protein
MAAGQAQVGLDTPLWLPSEELPAYPWWLLYPLIAYRNQTNLTDVRFALEKSR